MEKPAAFSVEIIQKRGPELQGSERKIAEPGPTQAPIYAMGNCLSTIRKRAPKAPAVRRSNVSSLPLYIPTAAPFTRSDFSFVEPSAALPLGMKLLEVPFRAPVGVLMTQEARPHKVLQITVTLDFPGQECNYHISYRPVSEQQREKRDITIVLSDTRVGGPITAVRRKRFPNGFVWDQGVVVDCGGLSGVWKCEFLGASEDGKQVWEGVGVVDVVVEEGDFGLE